MISFRTTDGNIISPAMPPMVAAASKKTGTAAKAEAKAAPAKEQAEEAEASAEPAFELTSDGPPAQLSSKKRGR